MSLSLLAVPTESKQIISAAPQVSLIFELLVSGIAQSFPTPQHIPVNDSGVLIAVGFLNQDGSDFNISQAQSMSINIQTPDSNIASLPAAFADLSQGTDGMIEAITPSGLLSQAGLCYVWGSVFLGGATIETTQGQLFVGS